MAAKYEIRCINKSDRMNPHERITHIGGQDADGTTWRITQQKAIDGIGEGKWVFYVTQGGSIVDVIVAISSHGYKYIKTVADGEQPNNLLSLPECK